MFCYLPASMSLRSFIERATLASLGNIGRIRNRWILRRVKNGYADLSQTGAIEVSCALLYIAGRASSKYIAIGPSRKPY